jgi:hypothetical protein
MIEFIIPTYNRPYQLLTIIGSLLSQNNTNWKMHIVADAIYPGYDDIKQIFSNINYVFERFFFLLLVLGSVYQSKTLSIQKVVSNGTFI